MKEILKDKEVFELAKEKVIAELEKEYDEIIEQINTREIEADIAYIEYRIGVVSEEEYNKTKNISLNRRTELQQKSKKILRNIKATNEMIY